MKNQQKGNFLLGSKESHKKKPKMSVQSYNGEQAVLDQLTSEYALALRGVDTSAET